MTPDEAEKLTLASTEGKLQLTLRNDTDVQVQTTSGIRLRELITRQKPAARPRRTRYVPPPSPQPEPEPEKEPQPVKKTVEVIRSNVRSEVTFEENKTETEPESGQ